MNHPTRITPSPSARRIVIGAGRGLERTHASTGFAFPCWEPWHERADAPGLMAAVTRWVRALLEVR